MFWRNMGSIWWFFYSLITYDSFHIPSFKNVNIFNGQVIVSSTEEAKSWFHLFILFGLFCLHQIIKDKFLISFVCILLEH